MPRGIANDPANHVLIPELDAAILKTLPTQGSKVGLKPSARQVKHIAKDLREHELSSATISGRLGALKAHGFAVGIVVPPVSNGKGWQVTPAGMEFIRRVDAGEEV